MHELAVASELLDLVLDVAREHRAGVVTRARLRIGAASCLSPDSLRFGFEALSAGTPAGGCILEVVRTAAAVACSACGWKGAVLDLGDLACPECARAPLTILDGRDLSLEAIEVD
jgi:hydrogenase nickel incorporation protein HypA/HybF